MKQSYLSEHYDLEDRILKYFPQTIKEYEERITGYEAMPPLPSSTSRRARINSAP